jgi:hypothetical protein
MAERRKHSGFWYSRDESGEWVKQDPVERQQHEGYWYEREGDGSWAKAEAVGSAWGRIGKEAGVGIIESIPAAVGGYVGGAAGALAGKSPQAAAAGAATGSGAGEALYQGAKYVQDKLGIPTLTPPPQSFDEFGEKVAWATATGPLEATGSILKGVGPPIKGAIFGYPHEAARLADKFDLSFTQGVQAQTLSKVTPESIVRRTITGFAQFYESDRRLATELSRAAEDVAREISGMRLSPTEAGKLAQETVRSIIKNSGERLGGVSDSIIRETSDPGIVIKNNVSKAAQGILDEGWLKAIEDFPSLGGVETANKARNILRDFAQGVRREETGLFDVAGEKIIREVDRVIPFSEAKWIRSFLFKIKQSGEVDVGKEAIGRLNHALHDAMMDTVRKAGRPDLADAFEAASSQHRFVMDTIEGKIIRSLLGANEEAAIDLFMRGDRSVSTATQFFDLIKGKPEVKEKIQAAVWRRIIERTIKEGSLVSNTLEGQLKQVRKQGMETIFSPEQLGAINDFSKAANYASLPAGVTKPLSSHGPSLLALGQSTAIVAGAGGMAGSIVTGNAPGFLISGAGTTAVIAGPYIMAKWMTRPDAVRAMTKAMKTPVGSKKAGQLASALLAMAIQTERRMKYSGEIPAEPDTIQQQAGPPQLDIPFSPVPTPRPSVMIR